MLANLPKMANLAKVAILTKFRQGSRRNHSTKYIKQPSTVPKCWRIWPKWQIWWKWRFLPNFVKGVEEIFRLMVLSCPERSQKVGEFGEKWQFCWNFSKGVEEIFRLNILGCLGGSQHAGEIGKNGKSGDSEEISPSVWRNLSTEYIKLPWRVANCWRIWQKWQFWRNFAKGLDEMLIEYVNLP